MRLGTELTPCVTKKFADQSIDVRIGASVRDEDVFVIQSGHSPYEDPNDSLMELLILISACKTASARRITAVIPSFPYSRHDKKDKSRAPITAKLVANMITVAGADHVITVDLHASQIQGFFDIPVDNLVSEPTIARWIRSKVDDWRDAIIVSPDAGGAKRATSLADSLGIDFALINRNRRRDQQRRSRALSASSTSSLNPMTSSMTMSRIDQSVAPQEIGNGVHLLGDSGEWYITEEGGRRLRSGGNRRSLVLETDSPAASEDENDSTLEVLVGDVVGKTAILLDDMVDTGRTLALASKTLYEAGAKRVFAVATHGLLSGRALDLIKRLNLERLVVTNTVCNAEKSEKSGNIIEVLDMSAVIAETIRRAHHGESISTMFRQDAEMMF
ncbi:ribose-phosphate diphosphokinase [Malassezia cuniculi]|uniref:ribose-phosphate diphosphokinase n=1 Tax=Malassezia cuniculi TaxID=948313 RepID=A0AAF0EYN3_9BASI|nr:ribose-phosphate diphosphokinase [Malassezia cuniculi]